MERISNVSLAPTVNLRRRTPGPNDTKRIQKHHSSHGIHETLSRGRNFIYHNHEEGAADVCGVRDVPCSMSLFYCDRPTDPMGAGAD